MKMRWNEIGSKSAHLIGSHWNGLERRESYSFRAYLVAAGAFFAAICLSGFFLAGRAMAVEVKTAILTNQVRWQSDYFEAYRAAQQSHKMLFIYFCNNAAKENVAREPIPLDPVDSALSAAASRAKLDNFVLVRLPLDATVPVDGRPSRLLSHAAFAELRGGPGLAIIDLAHCDAPYYTYVVSACPFTPGKYYHFQPEHVATLLDLPVGTLTQRTMVFAVRIHPERPASTAGAANPVLYDEAASHSRYQAQIQLQGHHQWESRFHRIISRLFRRGTPGMPAEVVAESWPNENLMDSCIDCVDSWRQSSGHWSQVHAQHVGYGYDIQRGANGIWYATGIFSN
ncbi:MAG TPA: hypothetical protein VHX65_01450 [Pirellulales bacterium]|jgi:hypothetical protein|nr:hypothetical protein [Pirellulales bacterium]